MRNCGFIVDFRLIGHAQLRIYRRFSIDRQMRKCGFIADFRLIGHAQMRIYRRFSIDRANAQMRICRQIFNRSAIRQS